MDIIYIYYSILFQLTLLFNYNIIKFQFIMTQMYCSEKYFDCNNFYNKFTFFYK
jgi:hypothetical protein